MLGRAGCSCRGASRAARLAHTTNGNGEVGAADRRDGRGVSTERTQGPLHLTDQGNAQRLVRLHGDDFRHCFPWGKDLVWDGRRWRLDDTAELERRAKE